jgi:hypothetical protein
MGEDFINIPENQSDRKNRKAPEGRYPEALIFHNSNIF